MANNGTTNGIVDVAGCMHFWGLTIDTVTSIILILAIGLAVDYSAHIGHSFMTIRGSRNDRVKSTLVEIGSPVFSGGFSTFLAFILLVGSNSYVFTTFFKVFLLVVVFGLFHGLVYLPTILSWIGPQPYLSAIRQTKHEKADSTNRNRNSLHGSDNRAMEAELQIRRSSQNIPDNIDYDNIGHGHPYIPPPDYTPPQSQAKRTELNTKFQKSRKSPISNGEVHISNEQTGPKSEGSFHNDMPDLSATSRICGKCNVLQAISYNK
ncbi:hypothetical protein KUTeg_016391 [Tegillarca granosa]|uniref:Uncharacterized protein n=1 Tax=Tegillarca granosa TaxID=220873 RepID=A0ABQ9EPJ7_TEGGR|nr:hypothetical protein KUTeg_016391 [Tegillarca granosa]